MLRTIHDRSFYTQLLGALVGFVIVHSLTEKPAGTQEIMRTGSIYIPETIRAVTDRSVR